MAFSCDTRFRFLLRSFGASVETAPTGGFPYFTPTKFYHGGNSETFNKGPRGFNAFSNPFSITTDTSETACEWTVLNNIIILYDCNPWYIHATLLFLMLAHWEGYSSLLHDALDRAARNGETQVIINYCFPIDLELNELGVAFAERTTYTGIYNISDLGFDMRRGVILRGSHLLPMTPVQIVLVLGYDPSVDCMCPMSHWSRCKHQLYTMCLPGYDPSINCMHSMSRWSRCIQAPAVQHIFCAMIPQLTSQNAFLIFNATSTK